MHSDTTRYIDTILKHNFLPLSLLPTRITEKTATIVDHIYYFEGKNCKHPISLITGNIICDISDHLANHVVLHNNSGKCSQDRPLIRLYTQKNLDSFMAKLNNVDWETEVCAIHDVNLAYERFYEILSGLYCESYPLVKMSRKGAKDKKWITEGLRLSCTTKNKLYKKWITTRCKEDEVNYKKYKQLLVKVIKEAKTIYYKTAFNPKINSIKKFWGKLNELCSLKIKK